jgi:hypothetical protein
VELERKVFYPFGKPWGTQTLSLGYLIFKRIDPIRIQDVMSALFSLLHRLVPTNIFFFDFATEILLESSTYIVEWT